MRCFFIILHTGYAALTKDEYPTAHSPRHSTGVTGNPRPPDKRNAHHKGYVFYFFGHFVGDFWTERFPSSRWVPGWRSSRYIVAYQCADGYQSVLPDRPDQHSFYSYRVYASVEAFCGEDTRGDHCSGNLYRCYRLPPHHA